jgi:hypothetical protein
MRNTGKSSEAEFEAIFARLGKTAFLERLADAAEIFGRVGRMGRVRAQVSDYIAVLDGITHLAEVKSTQDPTAFRFSLIKKKQWAKATMMTRAGGTYVFYVHRLQSGDWFRVPFQALEANSKRSLSWVELECYKWRHAMT